jgi:outer membrane protein assembly factor BamB
MVFAVTGTGEIIGMNASDGKIKWKIDNRIPISAAPTLSEGVLYITDRDNRLQAIDAESGRVLWDYRALPESVAYPRVASASVLGSVVIAPFTSGEVVAISAATSKAAWGKNVIGFDVDSQSGKFNTIIANPVIADKRVFVSAPTGTLLALDGATGQIAWDKNIALDATPLSAGDTLYMVDMKGRFISLRKSDGGIFYIKQLPHYEDTDEKTDIIRWSSPLMIDGNIITLSSHGRAYIIQPQTGKILHKYDTPKTWVDVSVSGGILYVLGANGKLYAYGS